jgi:hypothetical protein
MGNSTQFWTKGTIQRETVATEFSPRQPKSEFATPLSYENPKWLQQSWSLPHLTFETALTVEVLL